MFEVRTVSVTINQPMEEVYHFVHQPMNMAAWAKSFCLSVAQKGEEWSIETGDGHARVRFVEDNPYGVLDYYVTVATGAEIFNPMRVISNGAHCEVLATLFRSPEVSEEDFLLDGAMMSNDLRKLKETMELL
ncbi:hypothetical protein [Halobacillus seohaensis]|uniref:SRPBCC family protein n=1 Tax=Halobacillus seohaensis TaxID=447421 RepID=A0ABW2EFY9_9BACI